MIQLNCKVFLLILINLIILLLIVILLFLPLSFYFIEITNYYNNFVSVIFIIRSFRTWFFLTVLFVRIIVFIFIYYYINTKRNFHYFIILTLFFVLSILIFIISKNLFIIFIGWDGLGVVRYLLVSFYSNWKSINSGIITFLSNRVGDGIIILFISFIIRWWIVRIKFFLMINIYLLILCRITKSAQIPFSSWLPEAIAAPTPISALVHSSTLVTAGVFLLFKLNFSNSYFIPFIFGFVTFFIASFRASIETDFKKIVALSTLRQLGVLFIIFRRGFLFLFIFHLLSHAFFKRLLFIGVGRFLHSNWRLQDKRLIFNISSIFFMVVIQLRLRALVGILFLRGIISKDLFIEVIMKNTFINLIFTLSFGITFYYSSKMLKCFLPTTQNRTTNITNSKYIIFSRRILVLMRVIFGLWRIINLIYIPEELKFKLFWLLFLSIISFYYFSFNSIIITSIGFQNFLVKYLIKIITIKYKIMEVNFIDYLNMKYYLFLFKLENFTKLIFKIKSFVILFVILFVIFIYSNS